MNNHLPEAIRTALAPFAPKLDADPSPIKAEPDLRTARNDEPKFIRTPELDMRIKNGDLFDGNAWHEVSTGRSRLFHTGYDANRRRYLHLNDSRRVEIDTPESLRAEGLL